MDRCRLVEQLKKGGIPQERQTEVLDLLKGFLLTKYMPKMIETMKRSFKRPFPMCDIALVTTTCKIFDAIFDGSDAERLNYIEPWFALSVIWAFGGSVSF